MYSSTASKDADVCSDILRDHSRDLTMFATAKVLYYHSVVFRHETVSDAETGLSCPFALPPPNPRERLHLRHPGPRIVTGDSLRL